MEILAAPDKDFMPKSIVYLAMAYNVCMSVRDQIVENYKRMH